MRRHDSPASVGVSATFGRRSPKPYHCATVSGVQTVAGSSATVARAGRRSLFSRGRPRWCRSWTSRGRSRRTTRLRPSPLAALDLLDYSDQVARNTGRELLNSLGDTKPLVLARRSAKARVMTGAVLGRLLERSRRTQRPRVEGDPKTDTRAAAAHIVGVLWASASQGVNVKELRAAVGLSRERLEDAYQYLLEHPPLGLAVQRRGDELRLVTAPEVSRLVERHVNKPREVTLSKAALEVLGIVAYRQPIARSGIELVRGSASASALDALLERGLVAHNQHHLLVTTTAFLALAGLRDLADLPPLGGLVLRGALMDPGECSTPDGIRGFNTLWLDTHETDSVRCSTPDGIRGFNTSGRTRGRRSGRVVLNA